MSEAGVKVVRGLTEALLLLVLSRGAKHGYAVLKELEDLAGEAPNRNKVYPLLARLEALGLVERQGTEAAGGRSRTLYALTEAGREELERLRRLPEPLRAALAELWPTAVGSPASAPAPGSAASGPPPPGAPAFVPILAAPPEVAPGQLPYPCPDARVHVEKDPRTGTLGIRLTGCPMGAFVYCPQCPVYKGVDGMRRLLMG